MKIVGCLLSSLLVFPVVAHSAPPFVEDPQVTLLIQQEKAEATELAILAGVEEVQRLRTERGLKELTKDDIVKNQEAEQSLFQAKVITAKVLQLAVLLEPDQKRIYSALVEKLYHKMAELTVSGVHQIDFCKVSNAKKVSLQNRVMDVNSIFESLFYVDAKSGEAYDLVPCSAQHRVRMNWEVKKISARIAIVDALMAYYAKQLSQTDLEDETVFFYPAWNSRR